jgi:predicted MFS family arabinose efflux permease
MSPTTPPASPDVVSRALQLLALAGFVSMFSMRVGDPMLPVFVQDFQVSVGSAAQVLGAFALGYGVMQLFAGGVADRFGKYRVIHLATMACAVAAALCALAPTLQALLAARMLAGFAAGGIVPMVLAWIGDHVPLHERQTTLARLMSATVLGAMTGQWLGGLLVSVAGWRGTFALLALGFAAIAGLLFWRGPSLPEPLMARTTPWRAAAEHVRAIVSLCRLPRARRVLVIGATEGALTYGAAAFLPSHLAHNLGLGVGAAGAMVALFSLGGLVYARSARWVLPRVEAHVLLLAGTVMQVVSFLALAWLPAWWMLVPFCVAGGYGLFMVHNQIQVQATEMSPQRGLGVSLFALSLFAGQALNATAGGWLIDLTSERMLFSVAAAGALMVLGLMWRHQSRHNNPPPAHG